MKTKNLLLPAIIVLLLQTLSFSQNLQWAKAMGGTGTDDGYSIATDASGNVYTTGYFQGTADFDPGAGTFNLTSAGSNDISISKLDATGNFVWAKAMGGTGGDYGYSIALDASGNVYTTGVFTGTADFDPGAGVFNLTSAGGSIDIFISKLNSSGNFVWAKTMGGTSYDGGSSIALDASGNVYTTGGFGGTADFDPGAGVFNLTSVGGADIFISKLDASGNFLWAKSMGGIGNDGANSISLDASGNVYTTGPFGGTADFDPSAGVFSLTSAGGDDIFISKLDASGNFLWAKAMGGTGNESCTSIVLDVSGNVYTTGYFNGTADFDPGAGIFNLTSAGGTDIFISKLNSSGNFLWAKAMGGSSPFGDLSNSLAVDASGNVYSTGRFAGTADFDPSAGIFNLTSVGSQDIFISKLDASGNFVWAKAMGGTGPSIGTSIAVDASGNIYTTGNFNGTADFDPSICSANLTSAGGSIDIFVAKYDQNNPPVSVCIITVDSFSTKNIIVWDKPVTTTIDSFRIYRDSSTGYLPVVTLPYSALSEYTDNVNPNIHSYDYKISAIDNAGIESALSNRHQTMFMQKSQTAPPAFNLTWNDYCGFPVTKYYIWRDGNNTNSWTKIDSVNFGTNVFIDSFPPTQNANYRIEAINPQACAVTIKNPTPQVATIKSTKSNASERVFGAGVNENNKEPFSVLVYPNPSNGMFNVQCLMANGNTSQPLTIEVYNMIGDLVYTSTINHQTSSISLRGISSGVYHLQLQGKEGTVNRKIIIQQ